MFSFYQLLLLQDVCLTCVSINIAHLQFTVDALCKYTLRNIDLSSVCWGALCVCGVTAQMEHSHAKFTSIRIFASRLGGDFVSSKEENAQLYTLFNSSPSISFPVRRLWPKLSQAGLPGTRWAFAKKSKFTLLRARLTFVVHLCACAQDIMFMCAP